MVWGPKLSGLHMQSNQFYQSTAISPVTGTHGKIKRLLTTLVWN